MSTSRRQFIKDTALAGAAAAAGTLIAGKAEASSRCMCMPRPTSVRVPSTSSI